jgi:hypothetical protein
LPLVLECPGKPSSGLYQEAYLPGWWSTLILQMQHQHTIIGGYNWLASAPRLSAIRQ